MNKLRIGALALLFSVAITTLLYAAYTYYLTDTLPNYTPSKWTQMYYPYSGSGTMLVAGNPPDGTSDYEVSTNLSVGSSATGVVQFLRTNGPWPIDPNTYWSGDQYRVEYNIVPGWTCQGSLNLYKQTNSGGSPVSTLLASAPASCEANQTVRSLVYTGSTSPWPTNIYVFVNGVLKLEAHDSSSPISVGPPAITPYGNSVSIGPKDRVAPNAVSAATIGYTIFGPTRVDAQWAAASDDANGIGVWAYKVYKNGVYWTTTTTPSFSAQGLSAGTAYTFTIYTVDFHQNQSAGTSFTVTTPGGGQNPAIVTPPARTGVRTTGSYWGMSGEQIDMLTGNLNFSMPLLKAVGRGGWGQTFRLSYNSQTWRQDSGGTWKLGKDVGYGFGWRLMAGSIAPYWSDSATLSHYIFTDATGAEYKLDVNTNGVWSSKEAIYISYDGALQKLMFPDGSFWIMGCLSEGTEADAGWRYPTLLQDSNGNQVLIRYQMGAGAAVPNSSARITEIEDVRAVAGGNPTTYRTWLFTYNTDSPPHLTGISSTIGTGESYTLSYTTGQALWSPFTGGAQYGTTAWLASVTRNGIGLTHSFQYNSSGEMLRATFPYGGYLRWDYRSFSFNHSSYGGTRTVREVSARYLAKAGTTETTYALVRNDAVDGSLPLHGYTCLNDPSGVGQKCWYFNTTAGSWMLGLNTLYEERAAASGTVLRKQDFTWVQDAALNPYMGTALTTLDPGQSYQKQSKTEQTLDSYGNATQVKQYNYGAGTTPEATPSRTYDYTYLSGANYTSRNIRNRVSTVALNGMTLVSNSYDGGTLTNRTGLLEHDTANYGTGMPYRGNVTTSTSFTRTSNTSYDITGAVVSANDGQGHTVSVTQDAAHNYAVPSAVTAAGLTNSFSYNGWLGVTGATGANNESASVSYDSYTRPSSTTSPYGAVTNYTYTESPPTKTATTNGKWVKTTMDGLGRTIKTETGNSTTTVSVVDTVYDSCACSPVGKVKQVSQPYAPGGTPVWTVYAYDGLGRTTSVTLPDGSGVTSYVYQGNTTTVYNPAHTAVAPKWKRFVHDAFGNLVQVFEPRPGGGADYETDYSYDVLNHLTTVTMPRDGVTQARTWVYDASTQRLTSTTNPENGTATFTYNADGTLATKIDAKNQKIQLVYDASTQRVTQIKRFPVSTGPEDACQQTNFNYGTAPPSNGRLSSATLGRDWVRDHRQLRIHGILHVHECGTGAFQVGRVPGGGVGE